MNNEYSTPKLTPTNTVKIPSISGADDSGYMLNEELRHFMDDGITGVTEEYSSLLTYEYGKRLLHEGVEVRCIVPVESPEVFDPDKWQEITLKTLDERVLQNTDAINAISNKYSKDAKVIFVPENITGSGNPGTGQFLANLCNLYPHRLNTTFLFTLNDNGMGFGIIIIYDT